MAKAQRVNRPSTLLRYLIENYADPLGRVNTYDLEWAIDEAKRYERRAKRRVSLAGGGDPARV